MQDFKKGDKVIHKLTNQQMTIKRISGNVATLVKDIPEPYILMGIEYPGDVAICKLENLELIKHTGKAAD